MGEVGNRSGKDSEQKKAMSQLKSTLSLIPEDLRSMDSATEIAGIFTLGQQAVPQYLGLRAIILESFVAQDKPTTVATEEL